TASVLNLTALSLERFIVIVFPMRAKIMCTMSNCRRSVVFVWLISFILAGPIIFVMETEIYTYSNDERTVMLKAYYCKDMDSLYFLMYKLLVLFLVPAVVMIIFYAAVIRELWRNTH
ncbi:unnamed protein product, partial [Meganyctiphanes norvegica]